MTMVYFKQSKEIPDQGYLADEMEKHLEVLELPVLDSYLVNKTTGLHE